MACDLHQLAAFVSGELEGEAAAVMEAHLDGCALCLETFALHATVHSTAQGTSAVLARGATLGRYLVVRVLGRGAMGVVYTAYDPELDRRIALKVVEPVATLGLSLEDAKARFAREARALARLAHPNVVVIFDVGELDGRVFIAMEHVDGAPLGEWLRAAPRTPLEILAVFYQAGAGLAAAHAANLVHRDFKPANVLVGDDGRARVVDFGLARLEAVAAMGRVATTSDEVASALVGTPAYMAPEQRDGSADARSDQYGFCVALAEALTGERPTADGTLRGAPIASWLARILRRGLATTPSSRFGSMSELLEALEKNPAVRRRRRVLAVVVAALCIVGAVAARASVTRRGQLCGGAAAQIEASWGARQRSHVEQHLRSLRVPYAAESAATALRTLDAWSTRWQGMFRDACEATHMRHEQSQAVLDLRMACLTDSLRDFSATTRALSTLQSSAAEHMVAITDALPPVTVCSDAAGLGQRQVLPATEAGRKEVDRISTQLATARTLERAGQPAEALKLVTPLVPAARTLSYHPLLADALSTKGDLQDDLGDDKSAEASMFEAIVAAEEGRDDRNAVGIRAGLAHVLASVGRRDEALRYLELASASLHRVAGDPLLEAYVEATRAEVFESLGRFDDARASAERALTLREETLGPTDHEVASALVNLGVYLGDLQKNDQALASYKRAASIIEATVGTQHPDYALVLGNIGSTLGLFERYGEASECLERALAIEARLGQADLPQVVIVRLQLGRMLRHMGRLERAAEEDREVARATEATRGADNPWLGWPLVELGLVDLELHRYADARVVLERALALPPRKRALKPEVKWPLAQAVWETDGKKSRARVTSLIADSLAAYDRAIPAERDAMDKMIEWKRVHLGAP